MGVLDLLSRSRSRRPVLVAPGREFTPPTPMHRMTAMRVADQDAPSHHPHRRHHDGRADLFDIGNEFVVWVGLRPISRALSPPRRICPWIRRQVGWTSRRPGDALNARETERVNLDDIPIAILRKMYAEAEASGDAALQAFYVEALERRAEAWIPQDYQQVPDSNFSILAWFGGRGSGKSDAGAGAMDQHANGPPCDPRLPGGHRMRIIGPTFSDAIASCIEGPSGLKTHNPSVQLIATKQGTLVRWPNGAIARVHGAYTPEDPERLRSGGNSCFDWAEEMAAWRRLDEVWDQAQFGLRVGANPKTVITTTPKSRAKVKELYKAGERYMALSPGERELLERDERVHFIVATTEDNKYLPAEVRAALYKRYAGTRLGAQELEAKILDDLGTFFVSAWFGWLDAPTMLPRKVRSWDLAGTPPGPANDDPDWTVGALIAYDPSPMPFTLADGTVIHAGRFVIEDVIRMRDSPAQVEQAVVDAARRDGPIVKVVIEREPGQSGKSQVAHFQQALGGIALVDEFSPSGPKAVRAQLVSGAAQQGRVEIVRAPWNQALLDELEEFTGDDKLDAHDDQVDALSQGFAALEGRGGLASAQAPQGQLPDRSALLRRGGSFADSMRSRY